MYVGRSIVELNDIRIEEWDQKELAYYHHIMGEMADLLNHQGASLHHKIIDEITARGGLHKDSGAWDNSSEIIYD